MLGLTFMQPHRAASPPWSPGTSKPRTPSEDELEGEAAACFADEEDFDDDSFETQRQSRRRWCAYASKQRARGNKYRWWLSLQRDAARARAARKAYGDPLGAATSGRRSPSDVLARCAYPPVPKRRDPTKTALASILVNLCLARNTLDGERQSPPLATRAINMDFSERALPRARRPRSPPMTVRTHKLPPSPPAQSRTLEAPPCALNLAA